MVHLPNDWTAVQVLSLGQIREYFSGRMAAGGAPVEFKQDGQKIEFEAAPMSLYQIVKAETR